MELQEQVNRIHEVMGIKDIFGNLFGKKELTKDEKLINVIANFVKKNYDIEERKSLHMKGDYAYWLMPENRIVFYYGKQYKRLEYPWWFAEDIHRFIGDDRLIHLNSEMIGKVFEKLYKHKVNDAQGYSSISV